MTTGKLSLSFQRSSCFYLNGKQSWTAEMCLTLNLKALRSSETSLTVLQSAWRYFPGHLKCLRTSARKPQISQTLLYLEGLKV
jgi:hypothetical protein